MIESISQRGYASTTVAHVIGLAGVSRRAFYEQFHNKEECFLATYDIVVARSRKQVLQAWSTERGWDNRLHASYKTLLDDIAAESQGRASGADRFARDRRQGPRTTAPRRQRLRAPARRCLQGVTRCRAVAPIASRAIVGGVRHVILNRMREGRVPELRTLADELLDWVEAYRTPALPRLNAIALKKPPEIPLASAAFLAKDDRRARVLGSVVHLTLDEGYGELTDPQIAQFAGISTEAFHKQFSNKEECFLTAIDEFAKETLTAVEVSIGRASSWTEAVPIAVRTFIDHIVSRPALLQMAFVDLFEVGPGMIGRMTTSIASFTALLAEGGPEPRRAPQIASEAITGAIWDIVSAYSSSERMRYLPCLADHIAFIVLAPYIGPKGAIDAIEQVRDRPELAQARQIGVRAQAGVRARAGVWVNIGVVQARIDIRRARVGGGQIQVGVGIQGGFGVQARCRQAQAGVGQIQGCVGIQARCRGMPRLRSRSRTLLRTRSSQLRLSRLRSSSPLQAPSRRRASLGARSADLPSRTDPGGVRPSRARDPVLRFS